MLRADPDRDTVRALEQLANVAVFSGSADADQLSAEALALGQDLDVDAGLLGRLFVTRGIYLGLIGRRPEAIAYLREGARLATQAGDTLSLGRTLSNLSHVLGCVDPAAAAEAARTAAGHMRRAGARDYLAFTIFNLGQALMMLGDWDAAEAELTQAADADGLAGNEFIVAHQAWLAALRGDADRAQAMLAALPDMRASEEPQAQAQVSADGGVHRGGPPPAGGRAAPRPGHAGPRRCRRAQPRRARWAWPLAARTAWELGDSRAIRELLAMIDALQPGRLTPMLRAERDLARARLASDNARPSSRPRSPACAS